MKNSEIAQTFRRAAEIMDLYPDEETVFLKTGTRVLVLHDPVVGSIDFSLNSRTVPVTTLEKVKESLGI